jgi:hypothetical protein
MANYEAVDRLMALATQKRADRVAPVKGDAAEPAALEILIQEEPAPAAKEPVRAAPKHMSGQAPVHSALDRARQILGALRPMLPAVAGAMRMVDHGAVQALARLLPLLGGTAVLGSGPETARILSPEQEQQLRALPELHSANQAARREIADLTLRMAAAEDQLSRARSRMDRMAAEDGLRERELHALLDRVRVLSIGAIVLVLVVVVQTILLVVLLHR